MSQMLQQLAPEDVIVTLRGEQMPLGVSDYAQKKIAHTVRVSGRPVHSASAVVRKTAEADVQRRFRVEATVVVAGTRIRAEAFGAAAHEATDAVVDLLRRRITTLIDKWDQRSRWLGLERPGQWRHGMLGERRHYAPLPVEEREMVRRKTFAIKPTTADEAAFDMEALGHDFLLFVDEETGRDALVYVRQDGGYGVLGTGDEAPPVLDEAQARERLDVGGERFVFHIDKATGRGSVMYRRYDGNYGVIEAA
ncbi:MAG TPA: HPF/RaiA family ribosome-associated protein [Actinomycetales bacterium]|nr:HPF/RaiA family ribosome-associated protein [Actinomycetales bacterium]